MNLLWIALLGAVVLVEKLLPANRRINYGLATVLIISGIALTIEGLVRG
jgi:predicted metal-binding membrane protein